MENSYEILAKDIKQFVKDLKKRPDIEMKVCSIGKKASKKAAEKIRAIHEGLALFYEQINGIHVEWTFIEPAGGGRLRIPPISDYRKFTNDDSHYMNFGEDSLGLLLDEITPEGSSWLVKKKSKVEIVFASAAEGNDGLVLTDSIEEYLRLAMKNGFVHYWPKCNTEDPYVSYDVFESTLEKFLAPPITPSPLQVGKRVGFHSNSSKGRGRIMATHEVTDADQKERYGNKLYQVATDVLVDAWIPAGNLKVLKKKDAYETIRTKHPSITNENVIEVMTDISRAVGKMKNWVIQERVQLPSNARRAAGILSVENQDLISFQKRLDWILNLHDVIDGKEVDMRSYFYFELNGKEFEKKEYNKSTITNKISPSFSPDGIFRSLFSGMYIVARNLSHILQLKGSDLFTPIQIEKLSKATSGSYLKLIYESDKIIAPMLWCNHNDKWMQETLIQLNLPSTAIFYR